MRSEFNAGLGSESFMEGVQNLKPRVSSFWEQLKESVLNGEGLVEPDNSEALQRTALEFGNSHSQLRRSDLSVATRRLIEIAAP